MSNNMTDQKEKAPEREQKGIFYKADRDGYCWAWKESMEKNVWGGAKSLDEIKRRASRMFSGCEIQLVSL